MSEPIISEIPSNAPVPDDQGEPVAGVVKDSTGDDITEAQGTADSRATYRRLADNDLRERVQAAIDRLHESGQPVRPEVVDVDYDQVCKHVLNAQTDLKQELVGASREEIEELLAVVLLFDVMGPQFVIDTLVKADEVEGDS